mmetsp:Transcript_47675/g.91033  ORF Transcript_47675/g.91033 Transcript_47675/m.91033 type:complete len:250 (+) Transcript_47675:2885-3634(+)
MPSSSSSDSGRLRSSISRSQRIALYCSGVIAPPAPGIPPAPRRAAMAAGEGVSMPGCAMGVMPGVKEGVAPPIMGVAPPRLGVALPMVAGVSSQRERLRLGVGVVMLVGVASQRFAPGVTLPPPGVAPPSSNRPGVGVSSQRLRREGVPTPSNLPGVASPNLPGVASPNLPGVAPPSNLPGVASPNLPGVASPNRPGVAPPSKRPGVASPSNLPGVASPNRPGVGVASHRETLGVCSGISHSDTLAFFA